MAESTGEVTCATTVEGKDIGLANAEYARTRIHRAHTDHNTVNSNTLTATHVGDTPPREARTPMGGGATPEPLLDMKVGDDKHDFLETGATHFTMSTDTRLPLSKYLVAVQ